MRLETLATEDEEKPWAVLVYMVSDDSQRGDEAAGEARRRNLRLDEALGKELAAIAEAADLTRMHIAVQVDSRNTAWTYRARLHSRKPKDFEDVEPSKFPKFWREISQSAAKSDVRLQKSPGLNSANATVLREFLLWGREQCRAKRYVILFWGHSAGPAGLFYDNERGERIAGTLSLAGLEHAFRTSGGPWDLILFRDCYMGTLETAYQLHGAVRLVFASQSQVPVAGQWPYLDLFAILGIDADNVPDALAVRLTSYHRDPHSRGNFEDVPYTLLQLEHVDTVREPLQLLVNALDAELTGGRNRAVVAEALERARVCNLRSSRHAGDPGLIDVLVLCEGLQRLGFEPLASHARSLAKALDENVIRWHHSETGEFRGISLYYAPRTSAQIEASNIGIEPADRYEELVLSRQTGWDRIALRHHGN